MQKVVKLSQRIGKISKGDRILHWDIVMFLGKYGKQWELADGGSNSDNILIYKLKDALMLDVPHHEGILKMAL
ncbi:jg23330 [Pararge aegeria aegeria]|uniref:Jg23330 protein n=1 Tax=Pararge aegeria aegeria TaxID=348720 RepID=A0A8S4QXS2_9NEOP|nr:jg23330 [Pararge aegeria aegeria]